MGFGKGLEHFLGSKGQIPVFDQADTMFSFVRAYLKAGQKIEKKYRLLMPVWPSDYRTKLSSAWL